MYNKIYSLLAVTIILALTACSSDFSEAPISSVENTCLMHFQGGLSNYSNESSTRAQLSIPDGATMYLIFGSGAVAARGYAVYDGRTGVWTLTYSGYLNAYGPCKVYYFPGQESAGGATAFSLTNGGETYACKSSTYSYSSGQGVTLNATLTPLFSRLRFKGNSGTTFTLEGISRPIAINLTNEVFGSNEQPLTLVVGSNGYTPYVYVTDVTGGELKVVNAGKTYTAPSPFSASVTSGYISVPTLSSHSQWTMEGEDPNRNNPYFKLQGTYLAEAYDQQGNSIDFTVTIDDDGDTDQEYLYATGIPSTFDNTDSKWVFGYYPDGNLEMLYGYYDSSIYDFQSGNGEEFKGTICIMPYLKESSGISAYRSISATYNADCDEITFCEGAMVGLGVFKIVENQSPEFKGTLSNGAPVFIKKFKKL